MIVTPIQQQPRWPALIDRQNPLGAKVITYLPLSSEVQRGTGNQLVAKGTGGTYTASLKGVSLKGDGVAGAGTLPLDLTAYSSFTVAFWLYWDANANDDHFLMEHSANWNLNKGWSVQADESGSGLFGFGSSEGDSSGYCLDGFTRPVAATWHRVVLSLNRATPVNFAWVDGVPQTLTAIQHTGILTGNFTSDTLNFFSRNQASLFGGGKLQDLTFYRGALTNSEALSDYLNPWQILMGMRRAAPSQAMDMLMGQSRQMYAMGLGA